MSTSRSFLFTLISILPISLLVQAAPQAVVTEAAVVTVFADGHGEGQGDAVNTVAAAEGVDPASGVVIPFVAATGGLVQVSTVGVPPAGITPAPGAAPSSIGPVDPSCNQCSIFFQYVSAYYWPTENTNNTACLAGVTEEANGPVPTDLVPQYPSNYLVFPTISAGNACTRVGNIYYDHTIAFAPGAISTIVGNTGVTQEFNFADLPCPPPEVAAADSYFYNPQWNPGRPYSPMIAPPQEVFDMDPAFSSCVAAVYQGFDPPRPFPSYTGPQDPGGGGGWNRRKRDGPGHMVPRGPVKTAAPWDS